MTEGIKETGTVKWFDQRKGYGFIVRDGTNTDVFVHATDLKKCGIKDADIDEGHKLSFEIAQTPRGIKATNIARIT